jgi:hypothetical protein
VKFIARVCESYLVSGAKLCGAERECENSSRLAIMGVRQPDATSPRMERPSLTTTMSASERPMLQHRNLARWYERETDKFTKGNGARTTPSKDVANRKLGQAHEGAARDRIRYYRRDTQAHTP